MNGLSHRCLLWLFHAEVQFRAQPKHCVTEGAAARGAKGHGDTRKDDLCGSGNSKRSFFEFVVILEILQEEEILVGFFSSMGAKVLAGHVFERMTL